MDGIQLDQQNLVNVLQNTIGMQAVRIAQLEAATQQLGAENADLTNTVQLLSESSDKESTEPPAEAEGSV